VTTSCIYEGTVRHRRLHPANEFTHRVAMVYVDLDELPALLDGRLARSRPGLLRFRGPNREVTAPDRELDGIAKRRDPQHLHLARSLVNIAVVERLIALRQQQEIDRASARRRADSNENTGEPSRAGRAEVERLRADARAQLAAALDIYAKHGQHRGIGTVYINSGLLHLDGGDLESAVADAARAFSQGEERRDSILLARARLLQCTIENARLEEQIGDDPSHHAQLAAGFARDAVEYARQTQNTRLLARAYVWQGLTFANEPVADLEAARRSCRQAMALLETGGAERQCGWDDLETLKSRVLHTRPIDPVLRAWSNGAVENKTFQQMTEEFARDSFENLLFGVCRFKECAGGYPETVTVVSWGFKAARFDLHREALRWPAPRFRYCGVNQPQDLDGARRGEAATVASFRQDRYGTGDVLGSKRAARNPFSRRPPYEVSCPEVAALLRHRGPEPFEGSVPW